MDVSAIVVILVLTALSIGAIVWMEMNSRRRAREKTSEVRPVRSGSVPEKSTNEGY